MDVKVAVATAVGAFREFYPLIALQDVLLEEVEESQDGMCWLITLGFDLKRKDSSLSQFVRRGSEAYDRSYKSFKIDKATGKVLSMKIRSVA